MLFRSGFSGDVTVAPVTGTSALDTQPDARTASTGNTPPSATSNDTTPAATKGKAKKEKKKK